MTASTEKFIKTIFRFQNNDGFDTKPVTIARELKI